MGYVSAFRGRRDSYQVPLALAETGKLDCFITDHYVGSLERVFAHFLPSQISEAVLRRREPGLPADRVQRLRLVAAGEAIAKLGQVPTAKIYEIFDPKYGIAAAKKARELRSDLFMYSAYAWEAFCASYNYEPRRVLFQYHPHHRTEKEILDKDRVKSASRGLQFAEFVSATSFAKPSLVERSDSAWQLADEVLCASSFTKKSLVEVGADSASINVIPYGVAFDDVGSGASELDNSSEFHALFVGSGIQRKGLHHLLWAWQRAKLPKRSRLTVVARVIDPAMLPLLQNSPGVVLRDGVSQQELDNLYRAASVFVMPSLIEGFGQVYLEALAAGLPVIGTPNTCLPDLGDENDGIFTTASGDVDSLVALLERLSSMLQESSAWRQAARSCAERFTWPRFRAELNRRL